MRVIKSDNKKIAVKFDAKDIKDGLLFFSEESDFIQVGSWKYNKNKKLSAHTHNFLTRKVERTQEFMYVVKGRVRAFIYDENEKLLEDITLGPHEGLILFSGGHGYEILDDDTTVIEVKNGPYMGAELERRRFGKDQG